ncbi:MULTISPECIES: hypothetical protein [Aquimarina]|uniref:Gingipain propeptide domain-containing protein n=1 Tax=Aquimarina algiphila TaxID=2047982 RepID=A0A554VBU0_9FLAO|nr:MULTISPECIES: hypothetical protein [Aquimarina]TSE04070.1 hypothetical protein FOF46_27610 [Aquimarina algiphila]
MKIFLAVFIGSISFLSYAQENPIQTISIEWEQLSAPISFANKALPTTTYQLMEVNLDIDLRQQALRKPATMFLELPKSKIVSPKYSVAIPQPKTSGFTISGSGYNPNTNAAGGIKNIAYKDASLYSGAYCPITGLAY